MNTTQIDIIATLGPASESRGTLENMAMAGMTIARFNFSHGALVWHTGVLENLRTVAPGVKVLQDLCGPKIRTVVAETFSVVTGDNVFITRTQSDQENSFQLNNPALLACLVPGVVVSLSDGKVGLEVIDASPDLVTARVTRGGEIKTNKGVNIPGVALPVRSLTAKDITDLEWGLIHSADYVALSFVKTAQDILDLRTLIEEYASPQKPLIVAKIETVEAIENIESILAVTDAIMVARGDMGVEIGFEKVPAVQKRIIKLCNAKNMPVFVATEMLESMVSSLIPTRAEVSDVFNAVVDGATGVMLSAESAMGIDPVNTVTMMRAICSEAEKEL
ncbi:MAG: pyruvate kinase [Candidatus Pacebacteria bacterium]|nr:pyruvate kinase [Candidatus Paceibacterota bacterium]